MRVLGKGLAIDLLLGNCRLLAEGGFSLVWQVEDIASGQFYAMKKILCHEEAAVEVGRLTAYVLRWKRTLPQRALREAEMHSSFDHSSLLKVIDFGSVVCLLSLHA